MPIHSPSALAVSLKNQRKKLKLSQKAVGDLVGLKQKTISAIESNPENMRLSTLFRVLAALSADIEVLPKDKPKEKKDRWTEEW